MPLTAARTSVWRVQVHEVLDQIREYSDAIRAGKIRGATGKMITNIIAVGIGGSYLGPAYIHEVLKVPATH
jgi:glucose-6-phosphate isomerase